MRPSQNSTEEFYNFVDADNSDVEGIEDEEYSEDGRDEIDNASDKDEHIEFEDLDDPLAIDDSERPFTIKSAIKWERKYFFTNEIPFQRKIPPEEGTTLNQKPPLEYFKNYFTDQLFENFASYSNIYAEQQGRHSFETTNASEMRKLFGLHMLMGVIKLPRIAMYWSPEINLQMFKSQMTCSRFFQLRNNLKIVNNMERPDECNDKFFKVRPLINAIRHRLLQLEIGENVSIDEQIIPFEGRLVVKMYVKGKPTPWGVKVFVLCGKDGMPYDFFIYQGSTTELSQSNLKNFGFCASVVLHLAQRLKEPGHKLYYDNYFSSYAVLEILREKGINVAGTIRVDRFANPPLLTGKEMSKKGRGYSDSVVSQDNKVVIVQWQDNKIVSMASNFVGIGHTDTAKRWDKLQKKHVEVTRPEIISLYNQGMGGVDLLDQLISYYRVFIKSRKWPLRVIFHFMDFAVCASWIEYRKDCVKANVPKRKIMDLLKFRMQLATCLIKTGNVVRTTKRGPPLSKTTNLSPPRKVRSNEEVRPHKDVRLDGIGHLPEHDQKASPTRCKNANCNGRTFFKCIKCNIHLCITKKQNCFSSYHRQ